MLKWFNNLKIRRKIILGFSIIIVISCVIGVVGILNLNTVQNSYAEDYTATTSAMEHVERISSHFQQVRVNILGYALATTKDTMDYYVERIDQHI